MKATTCLVATSGVSLSFSKQKLGLSVKSHRKVAHLCHFLEKCQWTVAYTVGLSCWITNKISHISPVFPLSLLYNVPMFLGMSVCDFALTEQKVRMRRGGKVAPIGLNFSPRLAFDRPQLSSGFFDSFEFDRCVNFQSFRKAWSSRRLLPKGTVGSVWDAPDLLLLPPLPPHRAWQSHTVFTDKSSHLVSAPRYHLKLETAQ